MPFVVWVILYCAVLWGVFGALLGAVAPNLRAHLGVSFDQIGWLMALWTSGGAVGSFMGGAVAKSISPQRLLVIYSGLVLICLGGVLLAPNFASLALAFFCIAVFETALFTLGHGLLAEVSDDPEERTRVISLVDVAYSSGTILSPLLVSAVLWFANHWRAPYAVFGLLAVGLFVLTLQRQHLAGVAFRTSSDVPAERVTEGYRQLAREPLVLAVCTAGIFSGLVEWGQYFWFVSYASTSLGLTEQSARMALGGLMVGMAAGRIWQAFWHSRWRMGQKLQGLSLMAALALATMASLPKDTPIYMLTGFNFLAGLGVSVGFPILLGSALKAFPHQAPRLSALLMVSFTLGSQMAALLLGYLAEHAGLRSVYGFLTLAALALSWAVWHLNKRLVTTLS